MPALKDYPKEDAPNLPSAVVFWPFRLMVGMGVLTVLPGLPACGYATDACIIRGPYALYAVMGPSAYRHPC